MPLTIALAPLSRANSTSRVAKIFTSTLGRSAVASSMKPRRSSALKSVFCLRSRVVDDADHDPVEDLRRCG